MREARHHLLDNLTKMLFAELSRKIDKFEADLDEIVIDIAVAQDRLIIRLNTEEQLFSGIRADRTVIEPRYTPYTVQLKRRKSQPTDRVTLKDTGDFYKSFRVVKTSRDELEIIATDEKAKKLIRKYGAQIIGLTSDHIDDVSEAIKEPLFNEFKKLFSI